MRIDKQVDRQKRERNIKKEDAKREKERKQKTKESMKKEVGSKINVLQRYTFIRNPILRNICACHMLKNANT